MGYESIDVDGLARIKPFTIMSYLTEKGWVRTSSKKTYYVYRKEMRGTWDEVSVPVSDCFTDYSQQVYVILATLSNAESRSMVDIMSDIVSGNASDAFQYRLMVGDESGTVPLDWFLQVLGTHKKLSAAAYLDIITPRDYHKNMNAGYNALRDMRMGQTSYGSFVVRIVYPYDGQLDYGAGRRGDDVVRRVATKIMDSSRILLEHAADDQQLEPGCGVSFNFVDSFMSLRSDNGYDLEIAKVDFRDDDPETVRRPISVPDSMFVRIGNVAQSLKPPSETDRREFTGRIYSMTAMDYDENISKFKVEFFEADGGMTKATVILEGDARKRAIASTDTFNIVKFTGRLEGYGRGKTIEDVENFRIVD